MTVSTAQAQTAPSSPTTPPADPSLATSETPNSTPTTVQPLTVTGKASADRRYIDRRSYSLSTNVQAANGSLADALRNIPSVDVDPRGNLSVLGQTNVTILVDGQPSALFQGANLADVLRELPADQYERVEVITNPSAAYKPDGSGGIINLIRKKSHHTRTTGTVKGSIDPAGRYNASVDGNATWKTFTVSGGAGARDQFNDIDAMTKEQLTDPSSGETARATSASHGRDTYTTLYAHGSGDDDLDAHTRLSAWAGYYNFNSDQPVASVYRSSATTGALAQDYDSAGDIRGPSWFAYAGATYRHEFAGDDHNLVLSLSYNAGSNDNNNRETLSYSLPVQPDLFQDLPSTTNSTSGELKAEYKAPMPADGRLDAGYDLEFDSHTVDRSGRLGTDPSDAVDDPGLTDRFRADQTINALFVTYQQPVGRFDVLPGLRLEAASLETDQLLIGARTAQTYLDAYPTLHLGYKWDDKTQLTLSYSRRVQRPNLEQLDPFRVYYTPLSYSEGDLRLKPSITDSYEAGYEFTDKSNDYLLTLYYRDQHDMFTALTENLGDGALLSETANVGDNRSAGSEAVVSQQVLKALSLRMTADVFWNQLSDPDPGLAPYRSGIVVNGHMNLNWDATPRDFIQFGVHANGRQITAQGMTEGYVYLDLGYRHKFSDRFSLEIVANDPTNSYRMNQTVSTPTLSQQSAVNFHQQAISVGFTYTLGGANKGGKDFDFAGGSHH